MSFVAALSVPFGDLHDGISVLDTDGITQAANSAGAALKVAELTVILQFDGVPYDNGCGRWIYQCGCPPSKNKRPAYHRPHRFMLYQFPRPYKNQNLPPNHLPIHPVPSWAETAFHIVPLPRTARCHVCLSFVSSARQAVLWIIVKEA